MSFTVINQKDNLSVEVDSLESALTYASMIYDGAGIVAVILSGKGQVIDYTFTPRGKAVVKM